MIRVPPELIEAIEGFQKSLSWELLKAQLDLSKSTYLGSWKPSGRGKALRVLQVCVGLHRRGHLRSLGAAGFSAEEVQSLRPLSFDPDLALTDEERDRLFTIPAEFVPGQTLEPSLGSGRETFLAEVPASEDEPDVSGSMDRGDGVAPVRLSLSPRTPVVRAEVTLRDRPEMDDLYHAPIQRGLVEEFGWRSDRATAARFVLGELLKNAFEHGCGGSEESVVAFSAEVEDQGECLVLTVRSPGPGFDFAAAVREGVVRHFTRGEGASGGLGLVYVSYLVDRLAATSDGREIRVWLGRDSGRREPQALLARTITFDGRPIVVLTCPRDLRWERMPWPEVDKDQLSSTVRRISPVGLLFDLTRTELIDSPSFTALASVIRFVWKQCGPGRAPFVFLCHRDISVIFEVSSFRDNLVVGSMEDAVGRLLPG